MEISQQNYNVSKNGNVPKNKHWNIHIHNRFSLVKNMNDKKTKHNVIISVSTNGKQMHKLCKYCLDFDIKLSPLS